MIPGRPYSFVAASESGRTSRPAIPDVIRVGPAHSATAVTANQLRCVGDRLTYAGHLTEGDPDIVVVMDAGYDAARPALVPADLPVEIPGRIRPDRVMLHPRLGRGRASVEKRVGPRTATKNGTAPAGTCRRWS